MVGFACAFVALLVITVGSEGAGALGIATGPGTSTRSAPPTLAVPRESENHVGSTLASRLAGRCPSYRASSCWAIVTTAVLLLSKPRL